MNDDRDRKAGGPADTAAEKDTDKATGKTSGKARAKACPVCGRASVARYRPFCSSRCADVDLGRWLKGTYHIPTEEAPAEESDARDEDEF